MCQAIFTAVSSFPGLPAAIRLTGSHGDRRSAPLRRSHGRKPTAARRSTPVVVTQHVPLLPPPTDRAAPRPDPSADLLTVAEAALLLRVKETTVRAWVHEDHVPAVGGDERIPMHHLLGSLDGVYGLRSAKLKEGRRMRAARLTED